MSGTANKTSTRKQKPTGTAEQAVEKDTTTAAQETQSDSVEQTTEPKSEKPVQAETDKPEQDASMAGSEVEQLGDESQQTKEGTGNGQLDPTKAADGAAGGNNSVLGILGAFKVRAKSAQGFWRSGVQFLRTKETIVLVVDEEPKDQPEIVAQEGIEHELVLFMSKEKARRVHQEPNLVVENVELSEVLDLEDMAQ
ncbi:hypothetical protein KW494_10250 [Vibrio fluvialis]|uniref:hypothetical protein n=1 Tax=Vibrio fluvialis TaxID=676 RepID=UPI001C9C3F32|nr:hypothetical protein [Vibrio fluvialis]MBY8111731.1 hypothetical protein [Vibrio fluvialis]MBY8295307.1 hypothetical protein [Vibrio fluvialis]MCE7641087.1 hypothetical protein [Vibrio fluvialis]